MGDWLFCCAARDRGDEDANKKETPELPDEKKPLPNETNEKAPSGEPAETNGTNGTVHHKTGEEEPISPKSKKDKAQAATVMQKLGGFACICGGDSPSDNKKTLSAANTPESKSSPGSKSPSPDKTAVRQVTFEQPKEAKPEEKAQAEVPKEEKMREQVEPKAQEPVKAEVKAEEKVEAKVEQKELVKEEPAPVTPEKAAPSESKEKDEPEAPIEEPAPPVAEQTQAAAPEEQSQLPGQVETDIPEPAAETDEAAPSPLGSPKQGPEDSKGKMTKNAKQKARKAAAAQKGQ